MEFLSVYLPVDRRHALTKGEALPDRAYGTALFADISGFTPLTAALAEELGRQRGAEEVLNYINPIYEAIIGELHRHRGSVIGFAGDSITCWLDGDDGRRGVACALNMQEIMARFATITTPAETEVALSIKVAVAAGPARRFLAGNPQYHNFEALAGATLERMAAAEHQAGKGDVVVSQEVVDNLGEALVVSEWRYEEDTGQPFAVVTGLTLPVETNPWPTLAPDALAAEQMRPWIDVPVYERLMSGATYVAELRPVTSLFVKFSGIDYDGDDGAGNKLDAYIRWVQSILARYEGYMLQLTIGDKGSNLLAVFGAPVAHDDDDARAVTAALDLQAMPPELDFLAPPRIGVSRGLAWAGACGGRLRCIYSVMGDEVNMAARLMGKAAPGQVLVNQHVADATARRHRYNYLGEIPVKGKTEPLPVSEAMGRQTGSAQQLAALFADPLVGREDVLDEMGGWLAMTQNGQGQVVRLEGGAGVGKSHLAAVFAEQAAAQDWQVVLGACQSITQGTTYAPWRQLLSALLELPADAFTAAQVEHVTTTLGQANPEWEPRLPLLGDLLGLSIPDTQTTATLEPQLRQQALFALVAEIAQVWASRRPLLLYLEDVHWLDEASADLAVAVARAISRVPALLLVVQRPPLQADQPILPELAHLSHHHHVQLGDLAPEGVAALVKNRLQGPASPLVQALILAQAQGNPFFTEELVDTLRETGYIRRTDGAEWVLSGEAFDALLDGNCLVKVEGEWQMVDNPPLSAVKLDIPDSVYGTVLARMDRLPEAYKLTLKVASVIGRTFSLVTLGDVHPAHPGAATLRCQIEEMGARDFVHLEAATPEPVYIFKHNTTQEVAYGTLLFAQRQQLHTAVAEWHERVYGGDTPLAELTLDSALAAHYPVLVHHWHHAEQGERERVYAGLAGEQAAKRYANESAVRYFGRALDLTPETDLEGRYKLLLGREGANDILGKREMQARDLAAMNTLVLMLNDPRKSAVFELRTATYADLVNDYPAALAAVQRAVSWTVQAGDPLVEAKSYHQWGRILWKQGDYAAAQERLNHSLALTQENDDKLQEARSLYDMGIIHREQANHTPAQTCFRQAQALYHTVNYQPGEIQSLLMFGTICDELGDYTAARTFAEQALALSRAIGWRSSEAHILSHLGNNAFNMGDYHLASDHHRQVLVVSQETGNRRMEAISLDTLSLVAHSLGDQAEARTFGEQALAIQEEIGDRRSQGYTLNHLGLAFAGAGDLDAAQDAFSQALRLRRELGQEVLTMDDLAGLARVALDRGEVSQALARVEEILAWLGENSADGIEFPVLVYLTCYQVLRTAADGRRAKTVLEEGSTLLQERANRIQDDAQRKQFLENVPFNRDLLVAYQKMQSS